MLTLYYHPICPLSRQVRLFLKEINLEFDIIREDYWLRRKEFMHLNPAGQLPVLHFASNDAVIVGIYPIIEYLADTQEDFFLMPRDPVERAETRKYLSWFNEKFYREVTKLFIDEKIIRFAMTKRVPQAEYIRFARKNLMHHLSFLSDKLQQGNCLVAEKLSCADIAAAANISVADYFGEITWDIWPIIKNWYSIIKSRPSFRMILKDYIAGFPPPKFYTELDF